MLPVGDKVVLQELQGNSETSGGIIIPDTAGGEVIARVVAVGKGIPFGRGEFYELVLKEGDTVLVARNEWQSAPSMRLRRGKERPDTFRVVHERQVLVRLDDGDL
jgi:co-chaperonin GroES (HSP10)